MSGYNVNNNNQSDFNPDYMPRVSSIPISDYKSSATWVTVTCSILLLSGLVPFFSMLISGFNNELKYMDHTGLWTLSGALLLTSIILSTRNIKVKGYQPVWEKWTMIGLTTLGVLFCFIPPVASLLYGAGIGR